jgi:hypothetical protein
MKTKSVQTLVMIPILIMAGASGWRRGALQHHAYGPAH